MPLPLYIFRDIFIFNGQILQHVFVGQENISKKDIEDILFYISKKNPELSLGIYQNHKLEGSGLGYQ